MLQIWYDIAEFLLPFEWIEHNFMKNALLAVLLITPLFGLLGTMVVSNKMAFFSDSIGHGAFTGIAIGALFGGLQPLLGAVLFSVVFAIVITVIKDKSRTSTDTIIGVFSSTAVAVGLILLSSGGFNKYSSYLVGDLLSIRPRELLLLLISFVAVIALWVLIFNKVLMISINQSLAASRGINTLLVDILFTVSIAVVVTITIQWVGLLIINSLIVLPAAASRNITTNMRQYHFVSVLISMFSGISGLIVSYYLDTPTGATIVLIAAFVFFAFFFLRKRFSQ
ncbi:MAG: metal ABC transporter permease [Acetivibrionales bacterium]|jgi:zinc transport system permease protein|nr:metal ABC transporter permease [Bacillota bacterium]NLP06901.1 metal ABC transporter permease [Clostridiaceae bacterium]HOA55252.1 metal ABC transporter permease [Clostridiales bacterium]HQD30546.1 metal ABC transporter permease [Clostridiales bacterium]